MDREHLSETVTRKDAGASRQGWLHGKSQKDAPDPSGYRNTDYNLLTFTPRHELRITS